MDLTQKEIELIREIRNGIMKEGKSPSVRELMRQLGYKSPRSISKLLEKLHDKEVIRKRPDGGLQLIRDVEDEAQPSSAQTVDVPLVGSVTCGAPLLAEENLEAVIPVSTRLAKPPHRYFLLRACGDSMNEKGIHDGDYVLVKQQSHANNGDSVVALIDDGATIKEIHFAKDVILLKPKSSNKEHRNIVLTTDFQIQGIVVATIPEL